MRLWEAFLLQMNDFDTLLEHKLRRMLDPVVARRPPVRKGRRPLRIERPVLTIVPPSELAVEAIPVTAAGIAPASHLLA